MSPKAGEIWLADLGLAAKTRPVVIVSRDDQNAPRVLFTYVPLTGQYRSSLYEVIISAPFLNQVSYANIQGIGSEPITRFERKLGTLSVNDFQRIKAALRYGLDL
jgi:mRNA interferase MazF